MSFMEAAFYVAGAVAVIATVLTITRLNAVHALLYLSRFAPGRSRSLSIPWARHWWPLSR